MMTHIHFGLGHSLATITQPDSRLAYVTVSVDISHIEKRVNPATELIFDDMILSGTKTMSREAFLDALKRIGATVNVTISNGVCTILVKALSENVKRAIELTFEALYTPAFAQKELKRSKKTGLNQLAETKDNSSLIAHLNLKHELFAPDDRRHELSVEVLTAKLPLVTRQDLIVLQKAVIEGFWYVTSAGSEAMCKSIKKSVETVKKKGNQATAKNVPVAQPKRLALANIPSRQNIDVGIGSVLPIHFHHPDYPALVMGIAILGKWGGFAGRLMSTVHEKEGLTYGIYAKTEGVFQHEHCYWRIFTFFAPEKVITGLTSTFREITNLYNKGISEAELKTFKTILKTANALGSDSLDGYLTRVHYHHIQGLSLEASEAYKDALQSLTKKQVNDAIKKYLDPRMLTVSCAGPIQAVKKDIENFIKTV